MSCHSGQSIASRSPCCRPTIADFSLAGYVFWPEEITEHVVPRPVAARAPFDGAAVVAHAAGAFHDRFKIGHLERNVIDGRPAGVAEYDVVVVGVDGHEMELARGVGHLEAEREVVGEVVP